MTLRGSVRRRILALQSCGMSAAAAHVAKKARPVKSTGGIAVAKGSVLPKEEPKKEIWDDGFLEDMMRKLENSPVFKELERKAIEETNNKRIQPYGGNPLFISSINSDVNWGKVIKQFQTVVASASLPQNP